MLTKTPTIVFWHLDCLKKCNRFVVVVECVSVHTVQELALTTAQAQATHQHFLAIQRHPPVSIHHTKVIKMTRLEKMPARMVKATLEMERRDIISFG